MNFAPTHKLMRTLMLVMSLGVAVLFVAFSNGLVDELSRQERQRMQLWADATRQIVNADDNTDIEFMLGIIRSNDNIPVLITDDSGNIVNYRNFDLPEPEDSFGTLSQANAEYLYRELEHLKNTQNVIDIVITPEVSQQLYYEDSKLLKALGYYPWVQLVLMGAFVAVVYFAVSSSRRAEQNKVWVGLTKETAHQLGTPISSLMAWTELLEAYGVDKETVHEIGKDVRRLEQVASRFGKIGSKPLLEPTDLTQLTARITDYMRTRISKSIEMRELLPTDAVNVLASPPLLEWVMENLIRNAVDAMDATGRIVVDMRVEPRDAKHGPIAVVEITDTGRGISRRDFKRIFKPGFTTKKRGWGLGLTLAKRIVSEYHNGRIYVRRSAPGVGTTFAVEIPVIVNP